MADELGQNEFERKYPTPTAFVIDHDGIRAQPHSRREAAPLLRRESVAAAAELVATNPIRDKGTRRKIPLHTLGNLRKVNWRASTFGSTTPRLAPPRQWLSLARFQ